MNDPSALEAVARNGHSVRAEWKLTDLEYPFHDKTITVTSCGRLCFGRQKINLSKVFAGQNVGVKKVSDKIWPSSGSISRRRGRSATD